MWCPMRNVARKTGTCTWNIDQRVAGEDVLLSDPRALVNEVALALLFGLFGWKVAALYLGPDLSVAAATNSSRGRICVSTLGYGWISHPGIH